ncbi:hypothetical protein OF850_22995 [Roseococcus sp. MDT2-1-1]|uniref:Uncharacterized protein n=1 Tax=Sabulicella glaciei TaxID=2984948 RepID=A0ABT3P205_9PROT|nr:hypothetical protein [Roseococcus sp. MDT2-1-1]MCW8088450.1 hypothetical protein [Roseococcus sp. MDT2-1-1]
MVGVSVVRLVDEAIIVDTIEPVAGLTEWLNLAVVKFMVAADRDHRPSEGGLGIIPGAQTPLGVGVAREQRHVGLQGRWLEASELAVKIGQDV